MQTLLPKKPFLQKNKICKTPGWNERGFSFNIFLIHHYLKRKAKCYCVFRHLDKSWYFTILNLFILFINMAMMTYNSSGMKRVGRDLATEQQRITAAPD